MDLDIHPLVGTGLQNAGTNMQIWSKEERETDFSIKKN